MIEQYLRFKANNRILHGFFVLVICLIVVCCSMFTQCIEAKAFLPAIPLIISAVPQLVCYGGVLLAALGLTYVADTVYQSILDDFFTHMSYLSKKDFISSANNMKNGIVNVTDNLYNSAKTFIDTRFNNNATTYNNGYVKDTGTTSGLAYWSLGDDKICTYDRYADYLIDTGDMCFEFGASYQYKLIADNNLNNYYYAEIYKNGVQGWKSQYSFYINPNISYDLNVNVGNNSRNGVDLIFCLVDKSTGEMITGSSISPDRITNINCSVGGDTSISLNKTIDVEANRDWKTDAGVRNLAVPTTFESVKALSSTDITTNVDGYTTVATPETPATNYTGILGTIIEVLNSIKSGVQSIVTFITDFFKNIIVALETVLQPVIGTLNDIKKAIADAVTAITAPIVQAISNIKTGEAEADLTTQTQNYNIPDLFVLILKVIIACISLVLRFIVYLLKMPFVEADTWGMSTNTINGIDFAKNVKIPYLNLSMWSIISSVISITYSITIMRKIRRFYSV